MSSSVAVKRAAERAMIAVVKNMLRGVERRGLGLGGERGVGGRREVGSCWCAGSTGVRFDNDQG